MKKILLVIPQVARVVGGGVATQAVRTFEETKKLGLPLEQYNPWESYDWDTIAAVHIFCANHESVNIAKAVKTKGIPLIVSSVFFSSHKDFIIRGELLFSSLVQKVFSGVRNSFDYVKDICTMADIVLPNTEDEKQKLINAIGINPNKITVIPNGVDDKFSKATPELFVNTHGVTDFILSVANLGYRRKNMLNLIRALKKINHPAIIIGPYFDTPYGKACINALEEAPQVQWIGQLENDSPMLASAFAGARVFALPSLFETPGIASMEAALAGTAVVTTPYGGTKEYFEDKALYARPKNINEIQKAIEKALNSPPVDLKDHIYNSFRWEKIALLMKDIYISFLNK